MIYFLLAITIIINLFLFFLILLTKKRSVVNIYFASFIFILCLFLFFSGLLQYFQTIFLGKLVFTTAIILLQSLLLFERHFSKEYKKLPLFYIILFIFGLFLIILTLFSGSMVRDKVVDVNFVGAVYGPAYPFFILFIFLTILTFIIQLIKKYQLAEERQKAPIIILLVSIILCTAAIILTNVILPQFGLYKANKIGPIFSLIFTLSSTYVIIRHRFLKISFTLHQKVLNIFIYIFVAIIFAFFILILSSDNFLFQIFIFVSFYILYFFTIKKIILFLETILFFDYFDASLPILDQVNKVRISKDLHQFSSNVEKYFSIVNVEYKGIFILERERGLFREVGGKKHLSLGDEIVMGFYFSSGDIISLNVLKMMRGKYAKSLQNFMLRTDIDTIVLLRSGYGVIGFFCLKIGYNVDYKKLSQIAIKASAELKDIILLKESLFAMKNAEMTD